MGGCSFDSGGVYGGGKPQLDSDTETDGGGTAGTAGTSEGTAATGNDPTADSATTTETTQTTQDSAGSTTAGVTPALLALDPAVVAFPTVDALGTTTTEVLLRNDGGAVASALTAMGLGGAFSLAGGAWPGTGGDCGPTLEPGSTCTLMLQFAPPVMGPYETELVLTHDDGQGPATVVAQLSGVGAQVTQNLLINGDAEQGGSPPVGWTASVGNNWTATTATSVSPSRSLHPGSGTGFTELWLRQDIDVSAFGPAVDTGDVRVDFGGWVTTDSFDSFAIRMEFLDAGGGTIDAHQWGWGLEPEWTQRATQAAVPSSTRRIRVRLGGQTVDVPSGTANVYFDDLSVVLSYP